MMDDRSWGLERQAGSYSNRARIGLVVPAGTLLDREYWMLAGGAAEVYIARTDHLEGGMTRVRSIDLGQESLVLPAVRQLVATRPHVVAFACTAGSFIGGRSGEAALRRLLEKEGAPKGLTTSGALVDALISTGATRVALATPYSLELTSKLRDFLGEAGIGVVASYALGMHDPNDVADLDEAVVKEMVAAADRPDAEAIFLSCTNLPTVLQLASLGAAVGKPVLSSNLVTMWAALRAVGQTNRSNELLPLRN